MTAELPPLRPGETHWRYGAMSRGELRAYLEPLVAKWWIPERFEFLDEIPKTSVGKFDKKVLRAKFAEAKAPVRG